MTLDPSRQVDRDAADDLARIARSIPEIPNDFAELRTLLATIRSPVAPSIKSAREAPLPTAFGGVEALSLVSDKGIGQESGSTQGVVSELFYGNSNLLDNVELMGINGGVPLTAAFQQVGPMWRARYVLNSGGPLPNIIVDDLYGRQISNANPMNTSLIGIDLGGTTNAYDAYIDIEPLNPWGPNATSGSAYLIAAARMLKYDLVIDASFTSVKAQMQVVNGATGAILASSTSQDYLTLGDYESRRFWASAFSTDFTPSTWRWRLRLHVVKAVSGTNQFVSVYWGEAQLGLSSTQSPGPFSPIVAKWVPASLEVLGSNAQTVPLLSISRSGSAGALVFSGGTATGDVKIERVVGGNLKMSSNGAALVTWLQLQATAGQRSVLSLGVTGEVEERTAIWGDATRAGIEFGGGAGARDIELFRQSANILQLNDLLSIYRTATSDLILTGALLPDTQYRWQVFADGLMRWGSGAATQDTNLYRGGADILQTDDSLDVAGVLRMGRNQWHVSRDSAGGYKNRLYFADNNRTYFGSQNGFEWRSNADANIGSLSNAGDFDAAGYVGATNTLRVNNVIVVSTRRPGWTAATGTAQRTSFATDTVTLINLARAVKAIIDDQLGHGLFGA